MVLARKFKTDVLNARRSMSSAQPALSSSKRDGYGFAEKEHEQMISTLAVMHCSGMIRRFVPVQPTTVAAPVQTEHSDNERSGHDDHPSDDDNNVSKLTGKQKKLFELRLKMNETRKANQTAMVE
ncbi:hypothetical protein Tco_0663840 [Tanacetum coccineum]